MMCSFKPCAQDKCAPLFIAIICFSGLKKTVIQTQRHTHPSFNVCLFNDKSLS